MEITYSVTVLSIPDNISSINNIATDNGDDPTDPDFVCAADSTDCADTTTPVDPDTIISKTVSDTDDGIAQVGEPITYEITVENTNDTQSALNVVVRDGLFEKVPRYMHIESIVVDPDTGVTGDLKTSGITIAEIPANSSVTITAVVVLDRVPNKLEEVINIVTDDGTNPTDIDPNEPDVCSDQDCDIAVITVDPETIIEKTVAEESGDFDGVIEDGETVTYQLSLTDPGADPTFNVAVRDSLIEQLPEYATYNEDMVIKDGNAPLVLNTDYTGDLSTGDLIINEVNKDTTLTITYSVTYTNVPDEVESVTNLVTDDGTDPNTIDPETCAPTDDTNGDCSEVTIPVDGETVIDKAITTESGKVDGTIEDGETVNYQVTVTNPSQTAPAVAVSVRDNLLENIPAYATLEGPIVIDPSVETTGSLQVGDFTILEIAPNQSVTISYALKFKAIPNDQANVANLATDSGLDPETCPVTMKKVKGAIDADCASVVTPVEADTTIEKNVVTTDSVYYPGDKIEYQLIIRNDTVNDALDVPVRDSLLENTPSYLQYNNDLKVQGGRGSGKITAGTFTVDKVPANSSVTITYSLTLKADPKQDTVLNVATDDGVDPNTIDPNSVDPANKGKGDQDRATIDVGVKAQDPTPDKDNYEDMKIAQTGIRTMIIIVNLFLILIVAITLKRRIALK